MAGHFKTQKTEGKGCSERERIKKRNHREGKWISSKRESMPRTKLFIKKW